MSKFLIKWPAKLSWEITIWGSKNAALPIMMASILNKWTTILKNVPDISDIHIMIKVFQFLNIEVSFENNVLKINTKNIRNREIPSDLVCKLRGSILVLWPLLARFWEVKMAFPWGCVLWKRPANSHMNAFKNMWAEIIEHWENLHLKLSEKKEISKFTLDEMSVTASENIIAFAWLSGITDVSLCASEPHVQDLCYFMQKLWVRIDWIWAHNLKIFWVEEIDVNVEYTITSDYLQVWTYAIAAAITSSHIIIKNAKEWDLDSFWLKMKEAWVKFEHRENEVEIFPSENLKFVNINTWVFPLFPTDLQAPFALMHFKANWVSKIFETLFENRLAYLFEIEKMWWKIEFLNPHQAIIIWWKNLKWTEISSCDIRAWAAMVLAALLAEWETTILNVNYIDRWYEKIDENLRNLWVNIERI